MRFRGRMGGGQYTFYTSGFILIELVPCCAEFRTNYSLRYREKHKCNLDMFDPLLGLKIIIFGEFFSCKTLILCVWP